MQNQRIVSDCDPGPDDAVALSLLKAVRPESMTVITSYGCGSIEHSTRNAAGFLDALKLPSPHQLIRGAAGPLHVHPHRGANLPTFFGANGFNNVELEPTGRVVLQDPTRDLYAALQPGGIHYCLTGPCTNLARLIQADPEYVQSKIERLYVMGGVLRGQGNEGPEGDKYAEFNFYLDAKAARIVLGAGIPTSLVTWEAAQSFLLPRSTIEGLNPKTASAEILVDTMRSFFKLYMNDNHQDATSEPSLILSDGIVTLDLMDAGLTNREPITVNLHADQQNYGRLVEDLSGKGFLIDYVTLKTPSKAVSYLVEHLNAGRE